MSKDKGISIMKSHHLVALGLALSLTFFKFTFAIENELEASSESINELRTIHIEDEQASMMIKALEKAQAHKEVGPQKMRLRVQDLVCKRLQRPNMPLYCECTFSQLLVDRRSRFTYVKPYKIGGRVATLLLEAEISAKVPKEDITGGSSYSAKFVDCKGSYIGGYTKEKCDILVNSIENTNPPESAPQRVMTFE